MSVSSNAEGKAFSSLASPAKIGSVDLNNRIVMASLTRSRAVPEDYATNTIKEYYAQRAGAGLILSEGTLISPQGTEWPHVPSLYSSAHAAAWKNVTDAVHSNGGKMFAQLWHVGRVAHPDMPYAKKAGKPIAAPSPISARGGKFRLLDDATYVAPTQGLANPREIVEEFRRAAKLAKEAGFDGVELHAANGYLIHQFLDYNSNQRTDEWGGSVENRVRLLKECLDAITEVWPADKVGIKMNPAGGYNDVGMPEKDTIETFGAVVDFCVEKGLAYIQLVRYLPFMDFQIQADKLRAETHLDVLEVFGPKIKTPASKTALFLNGNLSAEEADGLVKDGKIDAAVFGRSFIGNPDLPRRLIEGLKVNEDFGVQLDFKRFYNFLSHPSEGFTDYPSYDEVATKA